MQGSSLSWECDVRDARRPTRSLHSLQQGCDAGAKTFSAPAKLAWVDGYDEIAPIGRDALVLHCTSCQSARKDLHHQRQVAALVGPAQAIACKLGVS